MSNRICNWCGRFLKDAEVIGKGMIRCRYCKTIYGDYPKREDELKEIDYII